MLDMLTREQVQVAAAETMVSEAAIRAAAVTLCSPQDARTPADAIAVAIRLLLTRPPRAAGSCPNQPAALLRD